MLTLYQVVLLLVKDHSIFYCDSDILWTDKFNIDDFVQDDVCYLSDTNSYINAKYFDSKVNQDKPIDLEIGDEGIARSALRPMGKGEFNNIEFDKICLYLNIY